MSITKMVISMAIILSMSLPLATNSFAKENIDSLIHTNQQELSYTDEFTLQIGLKFPQKIEKGINSYKATLEYDENVFETVRHGDFTCENDWTNLEYNQKNNQFVLIKKVGSKEDETVLSLKLRRKENAKEGSTTVKVKEIVASDGKEDIEMSDISVSVNVKKPQTGTNITKPNEDNSTIESNSKTEEGKLEEPITNQSKDEVPENLAFKSDNKTIIVIIIITIILLLILVIITRKRFDKKLKRKHKMLGIMIISGILFVEIIGTVYVAAYNLSSKGELSGDDSINYTDVSILQKHLINLIVLPEEKLKNADMNNDGKITVTDLTLIVKKVEKTLDYTADILESESQNYYPNKNEEFNLRFYGYVSYDEKIKTVLINGEEYEPKQIEGSENEYEVKMNSGEQAGIKEFHFTSYSFSEPSICFG